MLFHFRYSTVSWPTTSIPHYRTRLGSFDPNCCSWRYQPSHHHDRRLPTRRHLAWHPLPHLQSHHSKSQGIDLSVNYVMFACYLLIYLRKRVFPFNFLVFIFCLFFILVKLKIHFLVVSVFSLKLFFLFFSILLCSILRHVSFQRFPWFQGNSFIHSVHIA